MEVIWLVQRLSAVHCSWSADWCASQHPAQQARFLAPCTGAACDGSHSVCNSVLPVWQNLLQPVTKAIVFFGPRLASAVGFNPCCLQDVKVIRKRKFMRMPNTIAVSAEQP